jgi:hypothetical protein
MIDKNEIPSDLVSYEQLAAVAGSICTSIYMPEKFSAER